jgi:hypothetical protein
MTQGETPHDGDIGDQVDDALKERALPDNLTLMQDL